MSNEARWLASEVDRWTADGIITPDQAARIRARYERASAQPETFSWGLMVFFALGAIIVGLGVILLLAYNWSAIPKAGKLAIIFGAVISAHVCGLRLHVRNDWRAMLGEGLLVFATMAFGAGIWLVAQIYNIDEHFPTGFLVWGLGAFAMAWALPSIAQALIATIVLTIWGTVEVIEFDSSVDWATLLLMGGLGALVWRLRSAVLLAVVLAGLYVHLLSHATHWGGGGTAFLTAIALSTSLIGLGELARASRMPERSTAVMRFFGLAGFMCCAYILTFGDAVEDILRSVARDSVPSLPGRAYRWGFFLLAMAIWTIVFVRRRPTFPISAKTLEQVFYPLGLLCVFVMAATESYRSGWALATIFNLLVLSVAALWVVVGCREGRLQPVVLGSVVLGLLVFARYFDLFDSLAARGLAFVLFGGALFAEGFYYRKMRQGAGTAAGGGAP